MDTLTANQRYHLILADIAMAAAIRTCQPAFDLAALAARYQPGAIRDGWLAQSADPELRRRVTALANAAIGSLKSHSAEQLSAIAQCYGIDIPPDMAGVIAGHFAAKRDAVLTYTR